MACVQACEGRRLLECRSVVSAVVWIVCGAPPAGVTVR